MTATRAFFLGGSVALGVLWWGWLNVVPESGLNITLLSVGKGDAVLIESSSHTRILIDAGPDRSILRALGQTLPPWARSLDAFIETARVSGATGGEADVLSRYTVGQVLTQHDLHRGQRLDFGGGVYADVLYPDRDTSKMNPEDGAIVLRVVYGHTSFLLKENISSRADEWVSRIEGSLPEGEVVIASSSPQGVTYVSNGVSIKKE